MTAQAESHFPRAEQLPKTPEELEYALGRRPAAKRTATRAALARAFRIGGRSIWANRLPVTILWGLGAGLSFAYWRVPGVSGAIVPLHGFLVGHPWAGAFLTQLFFHGLLPWVFYKTVVEIRRKRSMLTCAFQTAWACLMGGLCVWFFHFQETLFGPSDSFAAVLKKTLVDQFGWTVLLAPLSATFFFWLGRDLSLDACRRDWPGRRFLPEIVLPNLLMNWCVAIPTSLAVYSFPPALRLIVCGFIGTAWTLLGVRIGEGSART